MRQNKPQNFEQIYKVMYNPENHTTERVQKKANPPTKAELWKVFTKVFYLKYGKEFLKNEETLNNLEVLFYYFLNDPRFFECKNLVTHLNEPDFNKGLLIIGGVGIGKTAYLKTFETVFNNYAPLRFKGYSSKVLTSEYEKCINAIEKDYFFKDLNRKRLFIDDIGSENNASNYGIVDVVGNIITNRYDNRSITYATANFASSSNNVEETLRSLGDRYGHRIYDRLFEMFNIVVFAGQSLRK